MITRDGSEKYKIQQTDVVWRSKSQLAERTFSSTRSIALKLNSERSWLVSMLLLKCVTETQLKVNWAASTSSPSSNASRITSTTTHSKTIDPYSTTLTFSFPSKRTSRVWNEKISQAKPTSITVSSSFCSNWLSFYHFIVTSLKT